MRTDAIVTIVLAVGLAGSLSDGGEVERDAQALAEASRLGAYRPPHRTSHEQRHVRALLAVRESLVRARVRLVGSIIEISMFTEMALGYLPTMTNWDSRHS